jgi:hypothetical protein
MVEDETTEIFTRKKVRERKNSKKKRERGEANGTKWVAQNRQEVQGTYRSTIIVWTYIDAHSLKPSLQHKHLISSRI